MPVANYRPVAGKYGRVQSNGQTMNLDAHELRAQAEDLDTTHFESDTSYNLASPDPGSSTGTVGYGGYNVFSEGLVGVVSADIAVRGSFDTRNNPIQSPYYLWVGNYGSVWLGLTKAYGFTSGYRCLASPVATSVRGKAAFEATLKSQGLIQPPTGNL